MRATKTTVLVVLIAIAAALIISPTLFAVVLPGNNIGEIVAGDTVPLYVDVSLDSSSLSVSNGVMTIYIKTLDEITTVYTDSQLITISAGETKTITFSIPGSVTKSWQPADYKLLIEGRATDGTLMDLTGSIGDSNYLAEGGVAWQFTVLEAGSTPIPTPIPEMPDFIWGLIAVVIGILLFIVSGLIIERKRKRR